MQDWVVEVMEQFGYIGILVMMALENIFPPIPSEIVLPFGGFMTTYSSLSVVGVLVTATTGSLIGSTILYGIGRLVDRSRMEKLINQWGYLLRVDKTDIDRAEAWFEKYGSWTVLLCRMVPLVRSLISIPAGMTRMNLNLFLLYTLIGTMMWNVLLVYLGVVLGASWGKILAFMDLYSLVIYFVLGISVVMLIALLIQRRKN